MVDGGGDGDVQFELLAIADEGFHEDFYGGLDAEAGGVHEGLGMDEADGGDLEEGRVGGEGEDLGGLAAEVGGRGFLEERGDGVEGLRLRVDSTDGFLVGAVHQGAVADALNVD